MLLSLSIFMFYSASFVVTAEVIACSLNMISIWDLFVLLMQGFTSEINVFADAPLESFAGSFLMSVYEFNSGTSTFNAKLIAKTINKTYFIQKN